MFIPIRFYLSVARRKLINQRQFVKVVHLTRMNFLIILAEFISFFKLDHI